MISNEIEIFPEKLPKSLKDIYFDHNKIRKFPKKLKYLESLEFLSLSYNPLYDDILPQPSWFPKKLRQLNINRTRVVITFYYPFKICRFY